MKNAVIFYQFFLFACLTIVSLGCKKSYLDTKPSTAIIQPNSLQDLIDLMENPGILNATGALPVLACDDYYYLDKAGWQAARTATERNTYIWAKDVYGGETRIMDWNAPYQSIFYANNVLEGLQTIDDSLESSTFKFVKGWAYFTRAFEMYDLVKNYAPAFDSSSASTDLGIPLKLHAAINDVEPRATVKETYDQILSDLNIATQLLPSNYPAQHLNHPSKISAYGLFARIYLSMRNYQKAGMYADSSLLLYSYLIDYNSLDTTSNRPFPIQNPESIFSIGQVTKYPSTIYFNIGQRISIDTTLYDSYDPNDLRRCIFFQSPSPGQHIVKQGYLGVGVYPYTGIAVDEMYLIRAEAYARMGNSNAALKDLNTLLAARFRSAAFNNVTASSATEALSKILNERRKELVWRGIRWSDLKRLNKEGANISLTRTLNGETYTLGPNDPRYIFNIPQDEIVLSGIRQNAR